MRKVIYAIIILFPTLINAQSDSTEYTNKMMMEDFSKVQAFVPQNLKGYTYFYSSLKGNMLDSVANPADWDWICVTIDTQITDWVKITAVGLLPGADTIFDHLANSWMPINYLWINLSNDTSNIYSEPNTNSEPIKVPFQRVNLVGISKNWAKIKYILNEKTILGWVRKGDQCASPWTVCNY